MSGATEQKEGFDITAPVVMKPDKTRKLVYVYMDSPHGPPATIERSDDPRWAALIQKPLTAHGRLHVFQNHTVRGKTTYRCTTELNREPHIAKAAMEANEAGEEFVL